MKSNPRIVSSLRCAVLLSVAGLVSQGLARAQTSMETQAVADATVDSTQATSNFGGLDIIAASHAGTDGQMESFVRFDLSTIPPTAVVLGAVLTYQVTGTSTLPPTISFGLIEKNWVETGTGSITFATRPLVSKELLEHSPTAGRHRVLANPDLLAAIRGWVRSPQQNAGLRLQVTAGGAGSKARFAEIVARESAGAGRVAPTLTVEFADVHITTQSLPSGRVGQDYLARIEASTAGVPFVQWRLLDTLPGGFSMREVDGSIEFFGRPIRAREDNIRVVASDPITGARHQRSFRLRVSSANGFVGVKPGTALTGGSFDSTGAGPLVALSVVLENSTSDVVELQTIPVGVFGSVDNIRDLASIEVFLDADRDGGVDPEDLRIAGPLAFTLDDSEVTLATSPVRILAGLDKQLLVVITPRDGCPAGREFALCVPRVLPRILMVGSNAQAARVRIGRLEGPNFVCAEPLAFAGDANDDGVLDCLDAQILGRRVGAAANGADPNHDGQITRTDVELVTDRLLGRPIVTSLRLVEATGFAGHVLVVEGFQLDSRNPAGTRCKLSGSQLTAMLTTERMLALLVGDEPGEIQLQVIGSVSTSRGYTFVVP